MQQSGIVTDSDMVWGDAAGSRFTYHGGDLGAARTAFPAAPEPWIDLSTGINADSYPVPPLDPALWTALPEPGAVAGLEAAAARAYGTRSERVVAAPGTQALIQCLPHLAPARRVGILGTTYGEHANRWASAGAEVSTVQDLDALAGFDVAVVVNPNNPDGRLVAVTDLAALACRVGLLVVDEAFMDVMPPGLSLAPMLPDRTIVLRSFGKTYGLAGLRLGFAIASGALAVSLRRAVGPWAVSGPAIAIGCQAFDDMPWLGRTRRRLAAAAGRLDHLLAARGATVVGGTPLFRLADVDDAGRWFACLARAGILVRPFVERPRCLRFGLPHEEPQWVRLAAALHRLAP